MSQASKRAGASAAGAILAIILTMAILAGLAYYNLSTASPSIVSPGPTVGGFSAYCSGSPAAVAGVYPAGPGSTPPPGCISGKFQIVATIQDLYNPGNSLTNIYSCVFFWNAGAPATFTPTSPGVFITGGSWQQGPSVTATGGFCAPTSWTPTTGTQVVVKVCDDTAANCATASNAYSSQKTVAYCPLASQVPSVALINNTSAPAQACNPGPGWGSVPYATVISSSLQLSVTIPVVMIAGQAPTGSNSGYNSATPILLDERYQNGTDFTSASTCYVNTGANACDLPKATSRGQFSMTWGLTEGGAGTAPANPQGSGYMDFTPVDLQTGGTARNELQLVLSIEVKATTNNDMCAVTSSTMFGSPVFVQQKSGSATDVFYLYVLSPTQLTRITDASGNVLNAGAVKSAVGFDCSPVYNGSGDVVTITPIVYAYFSISYFSYYKGQTNMEASALTQPAVITIRT